MTRITRVFIAWLQPVGFHDRGILQMALMTWRFGHYYGLPGALSVARA